MNHPFIDGNKRTGYVLMEALIDAGGQTIDATEEEKYEMVISASTGTIRFDEIKQWLIEHVK
ncbi:type II toxin-antitoxin system death-on-curing family toxin [Mucilaginibacter sp. PPCGB 2223]|uniref:type II toxin-antitoxin system death-on-curing family toxin n=1 Tax=Mucilaginibacter sp. PPCGB 2223 TaxID=1886027 RepID=UPI00352A6849